MKQTQWVAHRGNSAHAPENTLAAFALAIDGGADGIEFDVHVTADGVPVVIHDATLERTTNGAGAVAGLSLDDIRTFSAGLWFGAPFAEERVPTLQEVLEVAAGRVSRIYPEIKGYRGADDLALILDMLEEYALEDSAVPLAFDWGDLVALRSASRRIALGFEVDRADLFVPALEAAAADGRALLACRASVLLEDPSFAETAALRGIELAAWTVNDAATARALIDMGVSTLMTDDVGLKHRL